MYTFNYSTTRGGLWWLYWRAWARPAGLWRTHVAIGVMLAAMSAILHGLDSIDWRSFLKVAISGTVGCVLVLPVWPQLMYKPQLRTLEVDETGYTTAIGSERGRREWWEIHAIEEREGAIVMTTRQENALLIPSRAFRNIDDRIRFLADAQRWRQRAVL
jgi:hypothetical protein